jgi:hypothetical protein
MVTIEMILQFLLDLVAGIIVFIAFIFFKNSQILYLLYL